MSQVNLWVLNILHSKKNNKRTKAFVFCFLKFLGSLFGDPPLPACLSNGWDLHSSLWIQSMAPQYHTFWKPFSFLSSNISPQHKAQVFSSLWETPTSISCSISQLPVCFGFHIWVLVFNVLGETLVFGFWGNRAELGFCLHWFCQCWIGFLKKVWVFLTNLVLLMKWVWESFNLFGNNGEYCEQLEVPASLCYGEWRTRLGSE